MRVLIDEIYWSTKEGVDITALPFVDVLELDEEDINDQDDFWEVATEALETKHNFECDGFRYQILEGSIN